MKKSKGRMRESADILIVNAEELVTLSGSSEKPRLGAQMRDLEIIHDGALAIREGRITAVGKTAEVSKAFRGENVLNAKGKTVLPGFVDPHTHLIFSGSREHEFAEGIEDGSYLQVIKGDGVLKTVRETRSVRLERLVELGLERLDLMLAHGTTTVEAKSGYGLNTVEEVRLLEAVKRVNQLHSVTIIPTFMGAHAIPPEFKNAVDEYVESIVEETVPKVADQGVAIFCDAYYEKGLFSLDQTRRILGRAKSFGLNPKIHADHLSSMGGAEAAAGLGVVSADHLNFSSSKGIRDLAEKGVVAVLLPAVPFSSMMHQYPDARSMIDCGVPVALGTGFNAANWVLNQQLVIAMACHFMRMTPAEAITAATINAAHAVQRGYELGSLEVGKRADISILGVSNHRFLGYSYSVNLVEKVISNGRLVIDREKGDEPVFLSRID